MALTEEQRARRETNRRAAQQRRIKLGLGRGLALTTFDLTGRTPTFVLDALPAELAHIVLDWLPCDALARLALTNREWAAHVASMLASMVTTFNATQERIAAATTFDELESLEAMVRAHPRMRLKLPDWHRIYQNPTAYDDSGWPSESLKAYEFHVNDFRAPIGSLLLPDGEPVFKAHAHRAHLFYKGHKKGYGYPLGSADERLVEARLHFRDLLEPTPAFSGYSGEDAPKLYEKLWIAATVRLAPKQFVELCAQTLDETGGLDHPVHTRGWLPEMYILQDVWLHPGTSLLRRGEWTPDLLRQLAEIHIGDSSGYADEVIYTKDLIRIFEDAMSVEVIKEFTVQLYPPGETESQYFWFHQISDSDCVNETGPRFHPSETHPHRGRGRTMEAHLQELVAHALPLGAAALTRLVKVAVAEVEDYYYFDEDDDDQYGDGHYDEDRHGYEVMAEFVDQWARQSSFLERDNLEEIIEMLGSLPEWLKKLLARKSLGWFEEIAKSGKADAARRLDVVMQICSALRREHVWAGWEERQQGEPIQ
jgi:hypothetical protein